VTVDAQRCERGNGDTSFFVGDTDATMCVVAPQAGTLRLAVAFRAGHAGAKCASQRVVRIINEGQPEVIGGAAWAPKKMKYLGRQREYRHDVAIGPETRFIDLPVHAGPNRLVLSCTDHPKRHRGERDGPRILLGISESPFSFTPAR
jgi:hypothetical protein